MGLCKQTLNIGGLHCEGCTKVIEQAVAELPGLADATASYDKETLEVAFDPAETPIERIIETVVDHGYECSRLPPKRSILKTLGNLLIVLAALGGIAWLVTAGERFSEHFEVPQLQRGMSYGMLFLVGLFTGFHCIGMCGGFVVGYTAGAAVKGQHRPVLPHLAYGLGKLVSYTVIGGAFGFLGSIIAFTPQIRGYAAALAGAFLVLFGINMLDWFPVLHRLGLRMPRFLAHFVGNETRKRRNPFMIGLLNGLMIACGPLQAMYVMAAGTGSFLEGAQLLAIFGLGTLPLMLGFGILAGTVSGRITRGLLKASALLVIALGLIMLNRGLALSGSGYDFRNLAVIAGGEWDRLRAKIHLPAFGETQTIRMAATRAGYVPNRFVLKQGVPVHWVIDGKEVTNCNHRIQVPALGLAFDIEPGENRIDFTPTEPGIIPWSCWMGMLQGSFLVMPADAPEPAASPERSGP